MRSWPADDLKVEHQAPRLGTTRPVRIMTPQAVCADSQLGEERVHDGKTTSARGKMWQLRSEGKTVLFDRRNRTGQTSNFPQRPCLQELDQMDVFVYEDRRNDQRRCTRPIVIITSNTKKSCRDAFLPLLLPRIFSSRDGHTAQDRRSPPPAVSKVCLADIRIKPNFYDIPRSTGPEEKASTSECLIG